MNETKLDGIILRDLIKCGYENLKLNSDIVNKLNVFPVPDGDTGTNMTDTLLGGYNATKNEEDSSIGVIASKCANGMLYNARGNSGVILSQLCYGMSKVLENYKEVSLEELIKALEMGIKQAYNSVENPTEGTMLTVARESVGYMRSTITAETSFENFICNLLSATNKSVQETPDKLAVLKESGVVDSGGAGLYYIVEGINKYIHGQSIDVKDDKKPESKNEIDYSKFNEDSVLEFGYCSEVLVQLQNSKTDIKNFDVEKTRNFLKSIGDSIVLVKTGSVLKIHVHTFTPYKLLEYCQNYGEFLKIKIENMTLQHNENIVENFFTPVNPEKKERKKYGIVAVASGDGLIQTFKDIGADIVIGGGQTNNPSTKDFIDAFEKINADTIFVFPNNSNIILTAIQAKNAYKYSDIVVCESKNIGQGYAAISMINLEDDDKDNILQGINEEMKNVVAGSITRSIRSTNINNLDIHEDDYIGIIDKNLVVTEKVRIRAIFSLIEKMHPEDKYYATIIYGKELSDEEKNLINIFIKEKYPDLEMYEIEGGQEVYNIHIILN